MKNEAIKLQKVISETQTKLLCSLMGGMVKSKGAASTANFMYALFGETLHWIEERCDPDEAAVEELCSIISAGEVGTMTDLQEAAMRFSQCTPEKQAAILTILRHHTMEAEA